MTRTRTAGLVLLWIAAGAGAAQPPAKPQTEVGKLDVSRTWELDPNEARGLELPGQPGPQTITVEFRSSTAEVSVYVFRLADAKGADGLLTADPKKALAGTTGKVGTVKAELPEKTPVWVVVRGASAKTTVDVKLTNQTEDKDARIKKLEEQNAALKKEVEGLKRQIDELKKLLEKKP